MIRESALLRLQLSELVKLVETVSFQIFRTNPLNLVSFGQSVRRSHGKIKSTLGDFEIVIDLNAPLLHVARLPHLREASRISRLGGILLRQDLRVQIVVMLRLHLTLHLIFHF